MAKPINTSLLTLLSSHDAVLSDCGTYRYRLMRMWDVALPRVGFLMLNPSTADATVDDPTIRKCVGFARRWGYGGIEVVNLFAYRSTDPSGLLIHPDPVGPEHARHFSDTLRSVDRVVCAWGCEHVFRKRPIFDQKERVMKILRKTSKIHLSCLGTSPKGNPYHPLMLAYSTPLTDF